MKKIVVSFRYTGENIDELNQTVGRVVTALRQKGHEVYCTLDDETWFRANNCTGLEVMQRVFARIDACDTLFVFIRSNDKSEGMGVEFGYAHAKGKTLVVALKSGVTTSCIGQLAHQLIEFSDLDDLTKKLEDFS